MTSTEYVAAVTVQAAAAAFNAFTNVSLARESLRAAEEEVAYAAASLATSYARLECAQEVLTAFKAVTPATVFVANNSIGGRYVTASDEARVGFVPAFSMRYADDWEWWGFDTLDLAQPGWEEVIFTSATSGSALRATPAFPAGCGWSFSHHMTAPTTGAPTSSPGGGQRVTRCPTATMRWCAPPHHRATP